MHDAGGRVKLPLKEDVCASAAFGGSRQQYRYRLSRMRTDKGRGVVMFVMMNPSTADYKCDDPTVAKCWRFANRWGFGLMYVGNTFAYRATNQLDLLKVRDPIGPENDEHLIYMAQRSDLVVFAYGQPKDKKLKARGLEVVRKLVVKASVKPFVLRLSKDGTPCHPLYLPESLNPMPWTV